MGGKTEPELAVVCGSPRSVYLFVGGQRRELLSDESRHLLVVHTGVLGFVFVAFLLHKEEECRHGLLRPLLRGKVVRTVTKVRRSLTGHGWGGLNVTFFYTRPNFFPWKAGKDLTLRGMLSRDAVCFPGSNLPLLRSEPTQSRLKFDLNLPRHRSDQTSWFTERFASFTVPLIPDYT